MCHQRLRPWRDPPWYRPSKANAEWLGSHERLTSAAGCIDHRCRKAIVYDRVLCMWATERRSPRTELGDSFPRVF